jgi:hypothetical protein
MSYGSLVRWGFAHEQTPNTAVYYARNRFKRRQRARRVIEIPWREPSVERIADPDNLIRVFYDLKGRAGQAPGPDGFTYGDWSRREVADILRQLSRAVCEGDYRPQPSRCLPIPKSSGGFRTLRIANLCDRVVAAALHQAMQGVWEPVFLPSSMGFRPGRGVRRLLAELECVMIDSDCWVLAIDDIKKAFDNVVIADVRADHARYIRDPSLLSLIRVVLQGGEGEKRTRGIDQGSAYSPTALNVRLHHAHDLGVNQDQHPPWYRYADNLVYICQSVSEGHQALNRSHQLLGKADFTLKGEDDPPVDLRRGRKAQLLGFTLSYREGGLCFELGHESWKKLEQNLTQAHETYNAPDIAVKVVKGWIASYGPAFASLRDRTVDRVLGILHRHGYRETCSRESLTRWWSESWETWNTLRMRVMKVSRRAAR